MSGSYGASIPAEMHKAFERYAFNYRQKEKDKMLARGLNTIREVGPTVQTDVVTYWEKTGGNDIIRAKITAKGDAPDKVGGKFDTVSHLMYQISVKTSVNERDLALSPELQRRNIEIATAEIRRLEDYLWINGATAPSLRGLTTAARANPNGKVAAYGASSSSPSIDSIGNWLHTDEYWDIYTDVVEAVDRIGDEFTAAYMVGRKKTISPIRKMDDLRNKYSDQILDLFNAKAPADFLRTSAYVPEGYVYILAKDMEFSELVISEDLRVDTSVGKDEGGNFPIVLREWLNLNEIHSDEGVSEIYTL